MRVDIHDGVPLVNAALIRVDLSRIVRDPGVGQAVRIVIVVRSDIADLNEALQG